MAFPGSMVYLIIYLSGQIHHFYKKFLKLSAFLHPNLMLLQVKRIVTE